jgi:hypothetical protein
VSAHERYVSNLVGSLTPEQVAQMVAGPPSKAKSRPMCVAEIHELVRVHGCEATRVAWGEVMADAAGVRSGAEWEPGWASKLAGFVLEMPVAVAGDAEAA